MIYAIIAYDMLLYMTNINYQTNDLYYSYGKQQLGGMRDPEIGEGKLNLNNIHSPYSLSNLLSILLHSH